MKTMYKVPLLLEAQDEGGWTVTSPLVPELITDIDNLDALDACVKDALATVVELYEDMGKEFPTNIKTVNPRTPILFETLVFAEA